MQIQCECGTFRAELTKFPKSTPGRLKCYCDDCQTYLHHLQRADLLDANGGTEIIPAYPADVKFLSGKEHLKCTRLHSKGMFRFSTTCCNTPVANTDPKRPWAGFLRCMYTRMSKSLDQSLGPIKSSVMGKYAHGTPPLRTPQTFDFNGFKMVMPFIIKGIVLGKARPSPFFASDGSSVTTAIVLTKEQLEIARASAGF